MAGRGNPKDRRIRQRIAHDAARIMAEAGNTDYYAAKRKAAEQLAVTDTRNLPSNSEIEQALLEYQRIFRADSQPQRLRHLREVAIQAMEFLGPFVPRLVGPVLQGTADRHSALNLHVFSDTPEEVGLFLMQHNVPYELKERRVRMSADNAVTRPAFHFVAGDVRVELTVFPLNGQRQAPLSPVDGRPMRRANLSAVRALLTDAAPDPG